MMRRKIGTLRARCLAQLLLLHQVLRKRLLNQPRYIILCIQNQVFIYLFIFMYKSLNILESFGFTIVVSLRIALCGVMLDGFALVSDFRVVVHLLLLFVCLFNTFSHNDGDVNLSMSVYLV